MKNLQLRFTMILMCLTVQTWRVQTGLWLSVRRVCHIRMPKFIMVLTYGRGLRNMTSVHKSNLSSLCYPKKQKQMLQKHQFDGKAPYRTRSTGPTSPCSMNSFFFLECPWYRLFLSIYTKRVMFVLTGWLIWVIQFRERFGFLLFLRV